jgi:REP element-mobilizing transposase RayT
MRISGSLSHNYTVSFHRRRLPHWQPEGRPLFLTWHLYGSLPRNRFPPPGAISAGKAFVWMDRFLDQAQFGPLWLRRDDLAELVVNSLEYAAHSLDFYGLDAFVVMANHIHVLVSPRVPVPRLLQSVKGYTAREANRVLGRTGEPFWQSESYDHWVRDEAEFERVRAYVEHNPVRAGVVARAEEFRWSSAYAGRNA